MSDQSLLHHRHRRSGVRRPSGPATALALALILVVTACGGGGASSTDAKAEASTTTVTGSKGSTTTAAPDTDPTAAPEGEVATAKPTPSAGCGTSTVRAVDKEKRTLPDSDRWYLLTTPPEHDGRTPLPLVLDFHGLSEGAEIHSLMSGFGPYAAEHGFVAVLPQGTGQPVRWDFVADRTGNADLVYVDALLDRLEADLCVDTSRIYATGLSNGAFLSSVLACTMADRFAAVAPVAGLLRPDDCRPARPIPVLSYHGTADPILYFNGGFGTGRLDSVIGGDDGAGTTSTTEPPLPKADLDGPGYPAAAAAWAEANGCTGDPTDEQRTETVIHRTWDCPVESPVAFEIVEGGGHSWPGSEFSQKAEAIVGPTDMGIDATDEIWHFFQRFALPAS